MQLDQEKVLRDVSEDKRLDQSLQQIFNLGMQNQLL
jgi:hypothetical protein